MIVKMYKTILLCLASEREKALTRLQELGVIHVEIARKRESQDRPAMENAAAETGKIINLLATRKAITGKTEISGEEVVAAATAQMEKINDAAKQLEQLRRDRDKLLPWGDFSPASVETLHRNGVFVHFCSGTEADLEKARAIGECKIITREKTICYFVVFTQQELDTEALPAVAPLPTLSLQECNQKIDALRERQRQAEHEIDCLAGGLAKVREYQLKLQEKIDFLTTRDGMLECGQIAGITGYVPESELERLRAAAAKEGWALDYERASVADPEAPTLVKIPAMFRVIEPMMNFLGIAPGYGEVDVSVCFLLFLSVFFGMIFGDGGYGALLLAAATVAWFRVKQPGARRALRLMQIFSFVTVVWGALTGSWFGIDNSGFPRVLRGIDWLTNPEYKDRNIQFLCFTLAIMHLSTGRLWAAILKWGSFRAVMGEIGWALILWGNFFLTLNLLVIPGPIQNYVLGLYIAGLALVVLCGVNWLDPGDAFNFPFGVIGSFVDILSYIRLYAVGMSSAYIASSFNDMAASLWNQPSPVMTVICVVIGVLVLLVGHGLNLALCSMGVLVHGVRLNTLEFSNHIGLRWAGRPFKAFSKQHNNTGGE